MSEDLIKREDAIEALYKYSFVSKDVIEKEIKAIPSAGRPQGEWIGEADGYYNGELVYDIWYCSNCDYVVEDEEPPIWNYCPNCGADMREREGE